MGAKAAAKYMGIGEGEKAVATLYQWVHRGKLPYIKVGRTLRFDVQALDKLMEERRVA